MYSPYFFMNWVFTNCSIMSKILSDLYIQVWSNCWRNSGRMLCQRSSFLSGKIYPYMIWDVYTADMDLGPGIIHIL